MTARQVFFVMRTEISEDGQYIPCIAVEGETGYYKTNWKWGTDFDQAQEWCDERNQKMGISTMEAARIQVATMREVAA